VFGLPGNPVSSLVCFHLFVRPALLKLAGHTDPSPAYAPAALAHAFDHRGDRPTYFPAAISSQATNRQVTLTAWKGSADLRTLTEANCLACFPEGDRSFQAGDAVEVLEFEWRGMMR
jgi:molybdopterin molybdotransferase